MAETDVETYGATADAADETTLRATLDEIVGRLGVPEVLVYNAAVIQWDAIGDLTVAEHLHAWAVNVVGAITTAAHLLPRVAEAGGGTYIITGGMPTPIPDVASLSLGKAGVRALAEMLEARFRPDGVHVATVTVAGAVAPGTAFDPDAIADEYVRLHQQPPAGVSRQWIYTETARLAAIRRHQASDMSPTRYRASGPSQLRRIELLLDDNKRLRNRVAVLEARLATLYGELRSRSPGQH